MNGVDYTLVHHCFRTYLRESILDGEMPFWNPYTMLGRPFLADPEVAAFYPTTWLIFVCPEPVAYWLATSLHLALGAHGMARLVRHWGAPPEAGVFAGIVFAVTPPVLGHIQGGLIGFVYTITWWPWVMRYVDSFCERWSPREILIVCALLSAALLAGHPHAFWLCGCSYGFFIFARCCFGGVRETLFRWLRAFGALCLATVGALSICAVQVLPLLELASQGNRSAGRDFAAAWSLDWTALSSLWTIVPPRLSRWWDGNLYIGVPVLIAGITGLFRVGDFRMRALLFLCTTSLAIALGRNSPLFDLAYPLVPALGLFRFNCRFGMFVAWALIVATACFWDPKPGRVRGFLIAGVIALSLSLSQRDSLLPLIELPLAFCITLAVWNRTPFRRAHTFLFATFFAVWLFDFAPASLDLGSSFARYTTVGYRDRVHLSAPLAQLLPPPTDASPQRLSLPPQILGPNSGLINKYSLVAGNTAFALARTWTYLHWAAGVEAGKFQVTYLDPRIFAGSPFPYKGANIAMGWDNRTGAPCAAPEATLGTRSWLTSNLVVAAGWEAALVSLCEGFDPQRGALVEPDSIALCRGLQPAEKSGSSRILGFGRNEVAVAVAAEHDTLLILAEAWYPGWCATIDGEPTAVFPANGWMRAVRVPQGEHKVVFAYRSSLFPNGVALSGTALLIWLAAWWRFARQNPIPTSHHSVAR